MTLLSFAPGEYYTFLEHTPPKAAALTAKPADGSTTDAESENYNRALETLSTRLNVERLRRTEFAPASVFTLDRMRAIARQLGDPQHKYKVVHVAGSKGKGTVCHLIAAGLDAACVGLYTSPHLRDIRERILVDGQWVAQGAFAESFGRVLAAEKRANSGEATAFELLTLVAFDAFAQSGVTIAVVEVGLGGGGDATNIVAPILSVLTAIHLEHTDLLGNSLVEIAHAKAGIIKPGVPALTFDQSTEIIEVFRARAAANNSTLHVLEREYLVNITTETRLVGRYLLGCASLDWSRRSSQAAPIRMEFAVAGAAHAKNAALALAAIDLIGPMIRSASVTAGSAAMNISEKGLLDFQTAQSTDQQVKLTQESTAIQPISLSTNLVTDSAMLAPAMRIAAASLPGRAQLIILRRRDMPDITVMCDGAHTPESIAGLLELCRCLPLPLPIILAVAEDKRIDAILKLIANANAVPIFFACARLGPRAVDPLQLLGAYQTMAPLSPAFVEPSIDAAIHHAASLVPDSGMILVTGSFAAAGEAIVALENQDSQESK